MNVFKRCDMKFLSQEQYTKLKIAFVHVIQMFFFTFRWKEVIEGKSLPTWNKLSICVKLYCYPIHTFFFSKHISIEKHQLCVSYTSVCISIFTCIIFIETKDQYIRVFPVKQLWYFFTFKLRFLKLIWDYYVLNQ